MYVCIRLPGIQIQHMHNEYYIIELMLLIIYIISLFNLCKQIKIRVDQQIIANTFV